MKLETLRIMRATLAVLSIIGCITAFFYIPDKTSIAICAITIPLCFLGIAISCIIRRREINEGIA